MGGRALVVYTKSFTTPSTPSFPLSYPFPADTLSTSMSASPDRGNGRNPDAERPDNGQMEHSFPPSQKTINPGSSTNGTHVGESSQDTSQREYSVRRRSEERRVGKECRAR